MLHVAPGKRSMNGYPLTERDMKDLLTTGKEANQAYAIGGALSATALAAVREALGATENRILWFFAVAALVLLALAAFAFGRKKECAGSERLNEIKSQTTHD